MKNLSFTHYILQAEHLVIRCLQGSALFTSCLFYTAPAQAQCMPLECFVDCMLCDNISLPVILQPIVQAEVTAQHITTVARVDSEHQSTRRRVTERHEDLRIFMASTLFTSAAAEDIQDMAEQLTAVSSAGVASVGGFFDGQNHVQSQTALNRLKARAHNKYQASSSVCNFGSATRTLAKAEHHGRATQEILSQRYIARMSGKDNTPSAVSELRDLDRRIENYTGYYCNVFDNGGRLGSADPVEATMCGANNQTHVSNMDIQYPLVLDRTLTLDINFTDDILTADEVHVISLSDNLYTHAPLHRTSDFKLKTGVAQNGLILSRSLFAKKVIANNSYNHLVGMKSPTTGYAGDFVNAVTASMNYTTTDATEIVGSNPSYYAQMDFLSKGIFQNPQFVNHLIDTPANIERQQASLQAIELMQGRDLYESLLRSEMLLSTLLETRLRDRQTVVTGEIQGLRGE